MNPTSCYVIAFGALVVATLVTSDPLHSRDVIDTLAETDDVTSAETGSPEDVIPVTSHLDKRIVNGEDAKPRSHKYIVSLQRKWREGGPYKHDCGGVLIDRGWVLTAAHCVDHLDLKDKEWHTKIRVVVGEHHLKVTSNHEQLIGVEDVIMYEGYPRKLINDIALIKLKHRAKLTDFVEIAKLPSDDNPETKDCITAGWGDMGHKHSATILQQANVTVITNKKCKPYFKNVTPGNVCTLDKPGKQPCNGDSGGPLVCGLRDKVLIGIVSYGKKGCNGKIPEVYTRVSKYLDFIKDEMKLGSELGF